MALKDVLSLVNDELILLGTLIPGTKLALGTSPRSQKPTPPAIYWAPRRGTGTGPDVAMSRAAQQAFVAANPGKSIPRALHVRIVDVDVHIWGGVHASEDDYSASESILNDVLTALHHKAYGCYQYNGEDWIQTGSDAMTLGRRCILHVSILVPIIETPPTTDSTTIGAITITTQMGPMPPSGSTVNNP